jgi:predicted AlkP superfamily phosphohydrolase/phosphomutase
MKNRVIAIGLDAGDPVLIEKWISQGYLKNFNKLRRQGAYGAIANTVKYCGQKTEFIVTEGLWAQFSTGCGADKTGYWDIVTYKPENYEIECDLFLSGYDYQEYPPFYALGDDYKIAIFDLPVSRICDRVNGIQALGWGGHFPYSPNLSNPPEIFPEIVSKYGENPILFNDDGIWWDKDYVKWLRQALAESVTKRTAISCDLLGREPWNLFVTIFGEPHTAGHDIYNYSQADHPLYPHLSKNGTVPDPLLETYQNIDLGIEKILAQAPEDAYIVFFSLHGMGTNYSDLPSTAFLPELLYRFNFPGKVALAPGNLNVNLPPIASNPVRNTWPGEMWSSNYEPNPLKRLLKPWIPSKYLESDLNGLASPYPLMRESVPFGWMPVMWYRPLWPQMKAFALPSFAHGHIRINLQGREGNGIVAPAEYESLCDELTGILYRLKDGRTGKPLVKQVVRPRQSAAANDPKLPDSDLLVLWNEIMTDVVDSPDLGRIGPVTYFRAGSHWNRGFLIAKGPGITPGSSLPDGETVDLAPTILELMGAPIPDYFDGKSLLKILVNR